jgi:hypothetical protein
MPAKKNPSTDLSVKPAVPSKQKNAHPKAKSTASAKPVKTGKPAEKPVVKKAAPAKKKPAPVAKPAEITSPASEPISSFSAPVAPAPELSGPPAEPVTPVSPAPVPTAPVPPAPVRPVVPPQPYPSGMRKPDQLQAIAVMTLVNGILNILYGLGLTAGVVLGTFFFGLLCAPVTILPVVLGIFEIIYAVKLLANPPQQVKPSQTIAILEIVAILYGNVISLAVGILALVFYSEANVKAYFARINGQA